MCEYFINITIGELELSNLTVFTILALAFMTFLSVIISSLKLFQSTFDDNNE